MVAISASSLALLVLGVVVVGQGQRIAERKCIEYRKATETRKGLIPLTLISLPQYFNIYNCSKSVDLIVGGETARKDEFPHQTLIGWPAQNPGSRQRYGFYCGGSLISDQFILTAAHCGYFPAVGKPTVVRLGENDLGDEDEDHVDFDIERFIKHPQYTSKLAYFDIALVKLVGTVYFSKQIRPACLWTGQSLNFTAAIATGFGLTENAGDASQTLQKVSLNFVNPAVCNRVYVGVRKFPRKLDGGQLCMAAPQGERGDTCQGDSGGPIQVVTDTEGCTYHVVAITSIGSSCGVEGSPAVYTKVSHFVDWIERVVWG